VVLIFYQIDPGVAISATISKKEMMPSGKACGSSRSITTGDGGDFGSSGLAAHAGLACMSIVSAGRLISPAVSRFIDTIFHIGQKVFR